MARSFVLRGALSGAIAGFVAFVFARIFAEPVIGVAIDYESGRDDALNALAVAAGQAPDPGGPDIFSRTVQANVGIGVGMVGMGIALGLLFAIAYTMAWGHIQVRPRVLALIVGGAGFLTLYATPYVKYPANPPAIGHEDTIGDRSLLYVIMVVGSVVALGVAVWAGRSLRERLGTWNATLVGGLVYVVLVGILMSVLPSLGHLAANVAEYGPQATETPLPLLDPQGHIVYPGFPADTLFDFRFYSFAAQLILWGVLTLVFGALAERMVSSPERAIATTPVEV